MNTRCLIPANLAALFVALLLALGGCQTAQPPNILFIFADDQRPNTIGTLDNPHIKTPNLDRLAREGFYFSNNYCMGSMHGAVCQPSRAMVMSGRSLYRVPMNLKGVRTLPMALGESGYVTFGTGKWHNGGRSFLASFQRGKAVFLGGMSNHLRVPVQDVGPEGKFVNKRRAKKFSSELFADAVIEFLKEHGKKTRQAKEGRPRPFFAYVAFTAPHDPRQPPDEFRQMYYKAKPPLPPNFLPQHPFNNGWMTGRDERLAAWPRPRELISDQLAEYYGMITHMDQQIGRIFQALEESGQARNTVIVYASDHGLALGSHGLLGKQSLYEHSMGCPLIVAGPGIPRGGSSRALTYLLDIYATVCDLTGTAMDDRVESKSLRPIWKGEVAAVRETLFTTYEDKMRAVRDERYKLIRYPQINYTQLFDLLDDPDELHSLASDAAQSERVEKMMALLVQWQKQVDDRQPLAVAEPQRMELDLTGRKRKPDRHQPKWIVEKYFSDQR